MKNDEEMGADRALEYETDDKDNEARRHRGGEGDSDYSPTSSSSSSSRSSYCDDNGGAGSYVPSWPQSYRQSIDMLTNVPSPSVGSLLKGGSSLLLPNTFLRVSSTSSFSRDDDHISAITRPLIHPSTPGSSLASPRFAMISTHPSTPSKLSFIRDLPPSPQCSTTQAIVNGINVLCGVGLLTTPYAIKEGGWLGILVLFALGSISCYTGVLLKRCLDSSPGLQTYPDIGQAAFGTAGRLCISAILYLELYACCVEYITLVSDSLSALFPDAYLNFMGIDLNTHQLFAATTAIAILPTVWLRDLSLLSYLSAGGVIASVLVVVCLLWVGVVDRVGFHPSGTALDLANLPVALGLYGFCYSGHSVFPNVYSSMKERSQFISVLIICFMTCTVLYCGVAVSGFMMFGESTKSQFTLNMPHEYFASKVAAWTSVVNPLSKYALTMTPVALSLEELLPSTQQSHFIAVSIRTVLVFSTLVVALAVPYFGFVSALLGSFFTMLVGLILPCACYLSIQRGYVKFSEVAVCILIILVGLVCSSIGTYTSIMQILNRLS